MSLIDVSLAYQAEAVCAGKRKPQMINVVTTVPVEIRDVENADLIASTPEREYFNVDGKPVTPVESLRKYVLHDTGISTHSTYWHHVQKNITGMNISDITPDVMLTRDMMPDSRIVKHPTTYHDITANLKRIKSNVYYEDDLKHVISNNKESRIALLRKQVESMYFLNGQLHAVTRGPAFTRNSMGHRNTHKYMSRDRHDYDLLDISRTDFRPLHLRIGKTLLTIDMMADYIQSKSMTDEMFDGTIIHDIEPFRRINKDAPGILLFNQMFGEAISENLKKLFSDIETYNPAIMDWYLDSLFEHCNANRLGNGDKLKKLYEDAIISFDYEKVDALINATTEMILYGFSEKKNKVPSGVFGNSRRNLISDADLFRTNSINNGSGIIDIKRIHQFRLNTPEIKMNP